MKEGVQHIRAVTQYVVGAAADYNAAALLSQVADDVVLHDVELVRHRQCARVAPALRAHGPVEQKRIRGAGVFAAVEYVALSEPALRGNFPDQLLVVIVPAKLLRDQLGHASSSRTKLPAYCDYLDPHP